MELHVHFDAAIEPRKQQGLKAIPSSTIVDHAEIKTAIEQYEVRLAEEHDARLAAVQAEQDLGEADHLDAVALADAIAADKKDPGDRNRQKQLVAIQDARRRHQATVVLLQRAVEGVVAAFAEHGASYEAELREQRESIREQIGHALDEVGGLIELLRRNSACLQIGGVQDRLLRPDVFLTGVEVPRGREALSPEELIEKLRALGAPTQAKAQVQHRRAPHNPLPNVEAELQRDPEASVLTAQRRAERMARRSSRAAERQARLEAENEALEAVR